MIRTYFQETFYDMSVDIARRFAEAIREAWLTGADFEGEKQKGFFLSKNRGFEDKLYVGNIHRIDDYLSYEDEELAEDDEIVNVVVIDGPVTRDGDGCSYGSKDHRDQILYANTIPQVKGHIFILNTPGGAASARIDYEQAIADCREKGKPTVAWVDGMCCSAGQLVASLCDRTIVMNGRDTMGCIGTMCAFWGVPHNTVDQDGFRYIELVSVTSPDKNVEYREACDGKTEKLQAELDKLGEEFIETVRQNRPLVKDEHLTGKTFDAKDVMGELVDEVGDFKRAIEAVFELAGGTMLAARDVIQENPGPTKSPEGEKEQEIVKPIKNNNMPNEEEKKAAEVANEQQAAEQEVPLTEEVAVTQQQTGQEEQTEQEVAAEEPAEEPATEEPATEEPGQEAGEEEPATEGESPAEKPEEEVAVTQQQTEREEPAEEEQTEQDAVEEKPATEEPATEEPGQEAGEEVPTADEPDAEEQAEEVAVTQQQTGQEEQPSDEVIADAQDEINRITETLHNAEAMVEERDKTIALLSADKETFRNLVSRQEETIKEMRSTIEKLQKQVSDLKSEIKELSGKPAPMTNGESGIPADNGTGDTPNVNKHQRIKSGMSYEEIRASQKKG